MRRLSISILYLLFVTLSTGPLLGQDVKWIEGGYTDDVNYVAFAPDGSYLAISAWGGITRFYDRATLHVIRSFRDPTNSHYMFDISPDGKYLASGRYAVNIWDAGTGELIRTLAGHAQRVPALSFSPDSRYLATASYDSTVTLWDVSTGDSLRRFTGHRGGVTAVAFSSDGRSIVSTGQDSTLRIWSVSSGELVRTIPVGTVVYSGVFSPDDSLIASGVADSTVTLWNASSGSVRKKFGPHLNIYRVLFSPDGKQICCGGLLPIITIREVATGILVREWNAGSGGITSLAYSPDGQEIVHTGRPVKVWNVSTGINESVIAGHTYEVKSVAFSPSGEYCASGGRDGQMIIRNGTSGQWQASFRLGSLLDIIPIAFSADEKFLAAGGGGYSMRVWRSGTWDSVGLAASASPPFAFAPEGSEIAAKGPESILRWDISTGNRLLTLIGLTGTSACLGFSSDGKYLAAGKSYDPNSQNMIQVWDVTSENPVKGLRCPAGQSVRVLSFSPDGQRLAACLADGSIMIWESTSWDSLMSIGAASPTLSFSPDGRYLATGGDSIQIWDAVTGSRAKTLHGYDSYHTTLTFSPDGQSILSGTTDGCIILWNAAIPPVAVLEDRPWPRSYQLCQNYPNPFNPATTITYELPKSSNVRLSIYDILGREVAVLANERTEAGVHDVRFDAAGLASGVYFYRLSAGDFVQTRRLLLVR